MPARSRAALADLGQIFLTANVTYNKIETEKRKAAARDAVGPVSFTVKKDRIIVRKGDEVTADTIKVLDLYTQMIRRQSRWLPGFAGTFILYLFLLVTLWAFLDRAIKRPQAERQFRMMAAALVGSLVLYKAFLVLATIVSGALPTPSLSRAEIFYLRLPVPGGDPDLRLPPPRPGDPPVHHPQQPDRRDAVRRRLHR